jgi:hypothetical protein
VQFTPSTGYSRFTVPSNSCGRPRSESQNPSQAYALRPRRPRHSAPTEELGKVQFWTLAHGCGAASASQHSDHRACQQAGADHFDRLGSRTQLRNTHRLQIRLATRCDIALPYSMTSSARASSVGGTVRPRDRRCTPLFKPDWPAPAPIRCRRAVCQFD